MYSKKHYASNDVPLKILWHLMHRASVSVIVEVKRWSGAKQDKYFWDTFNYIGANAVIFQSKYEICYDIYDWPPFHVLHFTKSLIKACQLFSHSLKDRIFVPVSMEKFFVRNSRNWPRDQWILSPSSSSISWLYKLHYIFCSRNPCKIVSCQNLL